MKYLIIIFFILMSSLCIQAQKTVSIADVNGLFEFRLDSIERRITENKWGIDTSHYIHYTVKNISNDTLEYVTNSCFYYNHYYLQIGNFSYNINHGGGCYFNELTPYKLPPQLSFSKTESIRTIGLKPLAVGTMSVTLYIPLVKDDTHTYRVDGRDFIAEKKRLVFVGQTKMVQSYIDNRKRKKKTTGKRKNPK